MMFDKAEIATQEPYCFKSLCEEFLLRTSLVDATFIAATAGLASSLILIRLTRRTQSPVWHVATFHASEDVSASPRASVFCLSILVNPDCEKEGRWYTEVGELIFDWIR